MVCGGIVRRAYHEPIGDPCALCSMPRSRHWVRHEAACNCGASHRTSKREKETRTRDDRRYWVGCDGEGIGRQPHRYVYLAYSDSQGYHQDSYRDNQGIKTVDAFEFLLSIPTDARVAGYYLGYDWTMILRDLPNKKLYRLLRPELRYCGRDEGSQCSPVIWKQYKIQYLARTVRIKRKDRSVTIWDVGPFFQCSFVRALEQWGIGREHIAEIQRMKGLRSQFSTSDDIETYCLTECQLLAEMIAQLHEAHKEARLPLRSWHGPGATANVALRSMAIREKRGKQPYEVRDAANRAFFGGRFEHSTIGKVGNAKGHDLVSAYPFQAYMLPCLEHGVWEYTDDEREIERCTSAVIRYSISDCGDKQWAPLPCRMKDGTIIYPRGGFTGHTWLGEYLVARQFWDIKFEDAWMLHSDCACRPFEQVLQWFREREKLGKDGKGKVLKLALNSIYGKLAQSVGHPQYRSLVWAGLITSGTRAELLKVIAPHQSSVVAVATDGLYAKTDVHTRPSPLAPDRLGSWEAKEHPNLILVRPGIYWSDDQTKARGLGIAQLDKYRFTVLDSIEHGFDEARTGDATIFWGARQGVYKRPNGTIKRHENYGEWLDRPSRIRLTPLPKRNPDWSLRLLDNVESAPYGVVSKDAMIMKEIANMLWGQPV